MKVKDSGEITERISTLYKKYQLVSGTMFDCKGVMTVEQENRLIEQLSNLLVLTDRVIKNLILLEEQAQ